MATHHFKDRVNDVNASVSAQTTDDGQILLSLTCYPLSGLFSIPMATAVKLATDILEQAKESIKEAA